MSRKNDTPPPISRVDPRLLGYFAPQCYYSRKRARRERLWRIATSPWTWAGFIVGLIAAIAAGWRR